MDKLRLLIKNVYVRAVKKTFMNYNAESRALKAISADKKTPAPKYMSTHQKVLKYIEEHPEVKDIVIEKPKQLIEWLKKVKVVSKSEALPTVVPKSKLKSVEIKEPYPEPVPFGPAGEVKNVPPGRISLQQAIDLIAECNNNEEAFKPDQLAKDFKLSEKDICNLVNHFQPLELYVPPAWRAEDDPDKGLRDIWKAHDPKYVMPVYIHAETAYAMENSKNPIDRRTKQEIIADSERIEAEEKLMLEAEKKRKELEVKSSSSSSLTSSLPKKQIKKK